MSRKDSSETVSQAMADLRENSVTPVPSGLWHLPSATLPTDPQHKRIARFVPPRVMVDEEDISSCKVPVEDLYLII